MSAIRHSKYSYRLPSFPYLCSTVTVLQFLSSTSRRPCALAKLWAGDDQTQDWAMVHFHPSTVVYVEPLEHMRIYFIYQLRFTICLILAVILICILEPCLT